MATMAERLAAKYENLPIDPPKVAPDPIKEAERVQAGLLATDPNTRKFLGPPAAQIWFNGKPSGKRFSSNGLYVTNNLAEIAQLRMMQNVTELTKQEALKN